MAIRQLANAFSKAVAVFAASAAMANASISIPESFFNIRIVCAAVVRGFVSVSAICKDHKGSMLCVYSTHDIQKLAKWMMLVCS